VIALVVTPDGFPLAYEVMDGNTSEQKTLKPFLERIEKSYGKAPRVWIMDRGIPTEATLSYIAQLRSGTEPEPLARFHTPILV
jgi:transposase